MIYDTREVPDYKKDGWRWQKRKDKSGRVREDRAKLVLNRAVVVLGSYVHSADTACGLSALSHPFSFSVCWLYGRTDVAGCGALADLPPTQLLLARLERAHRARALL